MIRGAAETGSRKIDLPIAQRPPHPYHEHELDRSEKDQHWRIEARKTSSNERRWSRFDPAPFLYLLSCFEGAIFGRDTCCARRNRGEGRSAILDCLCRIEQQVLAELLADQLHALGQTFVSANRDGGRR
jgi:hypothetical protein